MAKAILVCMNPFKGTLTNVQACDAVAKAIGDRVDTTLLPLADGGRGTAQTVQRVLGGEFISCPTKSPEGREMDSPILLMPDTVRPHSALIESADTCGLHLLENGDPMRATSHGLGICLKWVLENRPTVQHLFIALGDSGTSDAGMGMLQALGFRFEGIGGQEIWGNADGLRQIKGIIPPQQELPWLKYTILCDVMNPLCGPTGSARVFAPQKGAKPGQVNLIEQGMENFAALIGRLTGRQIQREPMTGAAGGLGAAFLAFFDAQLVLGAKYLLDWIEFNGKLSCHDLLITGEGCTDTQTLSGKTPLECIRRANQLNKKTLLFSGAFKGDLSYLDDQPSLIGRYASGDQPDASSALTRTVGDVFSSQKLFEHN